MINGWATEDEKEVLLWSEELRSICSCLSSSPTHLSHTTNINPLENKVWEIYSYKEVCSFVHWIRHYWWLCFRIYLYMYVAIQQFAVKVISSLLCLFTIHWTRTHSLTLSPTPTIECVEFFITMCQTFPLLGMYNQNLVIISQSCLCLFISPFFLNARNTSMTSYFLVIGTSHEVLFVPNTTFYISPSF